MWLNIFMDNGNFGYITKGRGKKKRKEKKRSTNP
jgi:hypothetical protein